MFKIDGFEVKLVKSKIPAIIAAIILILFAIPFLLPSVLYISLIESKLESSTGMDFRFENEKDFSLFPSIRFEAKDVSFSGEIAKDVKSVGTMERVMIDIDLLRVLTGNIHVDVMEIIAPKITVEGDFTPYLPQWLRQNLSTARKEEIRYIEILQYFVEDSVFESAKIAEGNLLWRKNSNDALNVEKLSLKISKPAEGGDFSIEGNTYINNRTVDLKMRLEAPDDFLRGYRSKMVLNFDSSPLKIEFNGSAAKRQTFVAHGDIRMDIPSLYELCQWFRDTNNCETTEGNALFVSNLKLRDQRLQIEDARYNQSPMVIAGDGVIDFKMSKPEITGTITLPSKEYTSYAPLISKLQNLDFNKLFLDTFNANIDVQSMGVRFANAEMVKPKIKFRVDNGRLVASFDQLSIFGGQATGRLRWHKGIENGYMDARFDAYSINLEALQKATQLNLGLKGVFKTSLEVQAEGAQMKELEKSAFIHGEYSIFDGSIANSIISKALGSDEKKFMFTEIKGRIQGKQGDVTSDNIRFIAPFADVNGIANYNYLNDQLDISLNSETSDKSNKRRTGYVQINGALGDLKIVTSEGKMPQKTENDELLSGLLPIEGTQEKPSFGDEEIIIEETDLLE